MLILMLLCSLDVNFFAIETACFCDLRNSHEPNEARHFGG
jgi:hypothetical protein